MVHHEIELEKLRNEVSLMWNLTVSQMQKAKRAMVTLDRDLAGEVLHSERRVNAYELNIDNQCEYIIALMNPVAVDLRFVLAVLKINTNLERVGDIAEGIARYIMDSSKQYDESLLELTEVILMFEEATSMLEDLLMSFHNEDTSMARTIFSRDEYLNEMNAKANTLIANYIKQHPDNIEQALHILSTIRKLERVGDQSKNIAEEIIFYVEAKVLKHSDKKEK
ncbi:MAG: phosphate signaling complex protein PhoU [Flavobacteriales bacterium]|nr:phosphate signaling complex protein PhoU [Flavobacteriales bacterium]